MGKLNILEITLNNFSGVYYSGQPVDGYLTVELNGEMKMREIRLTFKGHAYVHWTEQHSTGSGKNRRTETRHYSASEVYFDQRVPVYGKVSSRSYWPHLCHLLSVLGHPDSLPAGRHTFPFSFLLPPNLPSSFEGVHGYVRYTVKATIDKPWKFDHDTKRPFTVICLLDLNLQPNAASGAQGTNSKMLCCLCCKSGPITGTVRIDRIGYVPGEAISINAEAENLSNRKCDVSARLTMFTTFRATTKSRTSSTEVARLIHPTLEEGGSDIWSGERLAIPPVPPSFLVGCNIIDIRYVLEFVIDPSGPAFKLAIPLEIIIGTIPLRSVLQHFQPSPPPSMAAAAEPIPPLPPSAPSMTDLPPPSYSDCMFGKVNIKEDDDNEYTKGEMSYAPKYTYYNWNQPQ